MKKLTIPHTETPSLSGARHLGVPKEPIPRRIIHIYCAPPGHRAELPLLCQASLTNMRLLHPNFEFLLFDKSRMDRFMEDECSEFRDAMESFPLPIQRFDFFRYLAVYRLGGFYFDLDVFLAS